MAFSVAVAWGVRLGSGAVVAVSVGSDRSGGSVAVVAAISAVGAVVFVGS